MNKIKNPVFIFLVTFSTLIHSSEPISQNEIEIDKCKKAVIANKYQAMAKIQAEIDQITGTLSYSQIGYLMHLQDAFHQTEDNAFRPAIDSLTEACKAYPETIEKIIDIKKHLTLVLKNLADTLSNIIQCTTDQIFHRDASNIIVDYLGPQPFDISTKEYSISTYQCITISPDKSKLLILLEGIIKIYDLNNKHLPHKTFSVSDECKISDIYCSNDNTKLAIKNDNTVKIYDINSSKELLTLTSDTSVNFVVWSPNDSKLAIISTIDRDDIVRTWNVLTGQKLKGLKVKYKVTEVIWSPDSNKITCRYFHGYLGIINLITDEMSLGIHSPPNFLCWSPDSKSIAVHGISYTIYDLLGKEIKTITEPLDWMKFAEDTDLVNNDTREYHNENVRYILDKVFPSQWANGIIINYDPERNDILVYVKNFE